jgi:hypothetical protein
MNKKERYQLTREKNESDMICEKIIDTENKPNKKYKVKTSDPVINDVIDRILKRHLQGMERFKKTMNDNAKPINNWIEDIIEEQIDSICYLVTLKSRYDQEILDLKKAQDLLRDDLQVVYLENGKLNEKIKKLEEHGKQKT